MTDPRRVPFVTEALCAALRSYKSGDLASGIDAFVDGYKYWRDVHVTFDVSDQGRVEVRGKPRLRDLLAAIELDRRLHP